jgi:hypothetical protein
MIIFVFCLHPINFTYLYANNSTINYLFVHQKIMSNKGFKFGQIVGIVVGVFAGSMLVNVLLSPARGNVQVVEQYPAQVQPQKTVF